MVITLPPANVQWLQTVHVTDWLTDCMLAPELVSFVTNLSPTKQVNVAFNRHDNSRSSNLVTVYWTPTSTHVISPASNCLNFFRICLGLFRVCFYPYHALAASKNSSKEDGCLLIIVISVMLLRRPSSVVNFFGLSTFSILIKAPPSPCYRSINEATSNIGRDIRYVWSQSRRVSTIHQSKAGPCKSRVKRWKLQKHVV